jgi:hypothetical protein
MEDVGFTVIGDESYRTSSLWQQHEMTIGPKVTEEKLRQVLSEIKSSPAPGGEARVALYRERIMNLLRERMSWLMISDIAEIESALGAENAILFVGRKSRT